MLGAGTRPGLPPPCTCEIPSRAVSGRTRTPFQPREGTGRSWPSFDGWPGRSAAGGVSGRAAATPSQTCPSVTRCPGPTQATPRGSQRLPAHPEWPARSLFLAAGSRCRGCWSFGAVTGVRGTWDPGDQSRGRDGPQRQVVPTEGPSATQEAAETVAVARPVLHVP